MPISSSFPYSGPPTPTPDGSKSADAASKAARPDIRLGKGLKHAVISENNGELGVKVVNEIGDKAIIVNNEPKE